jgi:hypothetical protein
MQSPEGYRPVADGTPDECLDGRNGFIERGIGRLVVRTALIEPVDLVVNGHDAGRPKVYRANVSGELETMVE